MTKAWQKFDKLKERSPNVANEEQNLQNELAVDVKLHKSMRIRSDFFDPNPRVVNLLEPPPVQDQKKVRKKMVFVIEKSNIVYHSWKIGSTILAFTSSFTYAYFAAFIHMMNDDEIKRA